MNHLYSLGNSYAVTKRNPRPFKDIWILEDRMLNSAEITEPFSWETRLKKAPFFCLAITNSFVFLYPMFWAGNGILSQLQGNNQKPIAYFSPLANAYLPRVKDVVAELVKASADKVLLSLTM